MKRILRTALAVAILTGVCHQGAAQAGEVKLLSALVMKPALTALADIFERTSGHALSIAYDSVGAVTKRIQTGEIADAAITQKPAVEALVREQKIASGSYVILARSGVGAAVPQGAPKPDIGPPRRLMPLSHRLRLRQNAADKQAPT